LPDWTGTVRRLLTLLFALDLLAILGLLRPLRLASRFPSPPLAMFDIIGHSPGPTVHYTLLIVAMLAVFVAAYLVARRMRGRRLTYVVFGGAALLSLTFLLMYPATNSDLFHYAMEGRIFWVHHRNPFTVPPDWYLNDPFWGDAANGSYIVWGNYASPYGPLWAFLTGIPLLAGHGDPIATYYAFKVMSIVFYFLAAVVIFKAVRMLRPGHEWAATLLWCWNPLVLMYVAGNGANDVIMMGLALLAIYLALRERWRLAFPVLALATLVKFVVVLLVPIFILYALLRTPRDQWRKIAESLAVSALIGIVLYAPFFRGRVTFTTLRTQASQFTDSPPALMLRALQHAISPATAETLTKGTGLTLFVFAYAIIVWRLYSQRRLRTPYGLVGACFGVMCAYLMLSVFWFQPWYLLWLISIGALSIGVSARITLIFSLTGLLTHTATAIAAYKGWYYTPDGLYFDPIREVSLVVLMVFVPPALYVSAVILRQTRSGSAAERRLLTLRDAALAALVPVGGEANPAKM
jgi:hypothetical protein